MDYKLKACAGVWLMCDIMRGDIDGTGASGPKDEKKMET